MLTSPDPNYRPHYKHNLVVNLLDGGFFGLALGFASFVTILPLFISTLTESATLIGLVPAIHSMGWQLPQLLTSKRVSQLRLYKPMTVLLTTQERLPFLGLAVIALLLPTIGSKWGLALAYALLIWQGIGGGFTATAWQAMIARIMPPNTRGTFFGLQSASANLLSSGSAIAAGVLLARLDYPYDFAACFGLAFLAMGISLFFLAQTREEPGPTPETIAVPGSFRLHLLGILRKDHNFRWFLVTRSLGYIAIMGFGFYAVYAIQHFQVTEASVGWMTAVLSASQIVINPLLGWIGDRSSNTNLLKLGALATFLSALLAWLAPSLAWFGLVFVLVGVANVALWTIGLAMTLKFGTEQERPAYIGMANTLVAPFTILGPVLGGWLADTAGYPVMFQAAAIASVLTFVVIHFFLKDPA